MKYKIEHIFVLSMLILLILSNRIGSTNSIKYTCYEQEPYTVCSYMNTNEVNSIDLIMIPIVMTLYGMMFYKIKRNPLEVLNRLVILYWLIVTYPIIIIEKGIVNLQYNKGVVSYEQK